MIGGTDKRKLFAAAAMCVLIAAVSVTGGLLLERRQQYVPEVEIIKAEPVTSVAAVSETVTAASETALKSMSESVTSSSEKEVGLVNINTASAAELDELKGIGEKTAEAIIEYRQAAPFEKIEDIKNVKGIGDKKFEDIKDMICV